MSRAPWRWRPRHAPSAFTRSFATAFPAPQNCGAVKAGWARKASGLWDGCTRQQHSAPPREYLLVFKDIDMKRAEESSALIQRAHQLHPLEFRLGHRATPAKLSRPNRGLQGSLYGVPIFLKDLGSGLIGRTQD